MKYLQNKKREEQAEKMQSTLRRIVSKITSCCSLDKKRKDFSFPVQQNFEQLSIEEKSHNLLADHAFELLEHWHAMEDNYGSFIVQRFSDERCADLGRSFLRMKSDCVDAVANGVYQWSEVLPKGIYVFSAYVRNVSEFQKVDESFETYLLVSNATQEVLGKSEYFKEYNADFKRISVIFAVTSEQRVKLQIVTNGKGVMYVQAAQLEQNAVVSPYSFIENGSFERDLENWQICGNIESCKNEKFHMNHAVKMIGDYDSKTYLCQRVRIKEYEEYRETYILTGWAKVEKKSHSKNISQDASFCLRAVICYDDGTQNSEPILAKFSPEIDGWQKATIRFSKDACKRITKFLVFCEYNYLNGTVYFDHIHLIRDSIELAFASESYSTYQYDQDDSDMQDSFDPSIPRFDTSLASYNESCLFSSYPSTVTTRKNEEEEIVKDIQPYSEYQNLIEILSNGDMSYAWLYRKDDLEVDPQFAVIGQTVVAQGNGSVKTLFFANGYKMQVVCNVNGQAVSERWFDKNKLQIAVYKYSYNRAGELESAFDYLAQREYHYIYRDHKIIHALAYNVTVQNELLSEKMRTKSIVYEYTNNNLLKSKTVWFSDGKKKTFRYESEENNK